MSPLLLSDVIPVIIKVIVIIFAVLTILFLLAFIRWLYSILLQYKADREYIEVTPPAFTDKAADATEALFTATHTLGTQRTLTERLLGRQYVFSAEIHSTKKSGIRFLLSVDKTKRKALEKLVEAYLPDAKVKTVRTEIFDKKARILEYRQAKHFVFPLHEYDFLYSSDPLGYITSAMTKLNEDEHMALQLVYKPVRVREADNMRKKILRNDAFLPESKIKQGLFIPVLQLLNSTILGVGDAFSSAWHSSVNSNYGVAGARKDVEYKQQLARGDRPVRTLSYFEHEIMESVNEKLKRPLFEVSIRVVIHTKRGRYSEYKNSINSALGLFEVPKYQALRLKRRKFMISKKILQVCSQKRLLVPVIKPNYFAATELASLFHFPHSESGKTENIIKSHSKTLPAPISLKSGNKLDVLIGINKHHGISTPIGLTESERQRHMYVIGGTGNGKTTMLKYQIVQDIINGNGVAVIDPHGDLAEELLGYIPEDRIKDVIYINPDDLSHPVGVNLLELPEGVAGDDLLREKDIVTESTVSVLRKIFSDDDSGGHRIEYVLRNTIQTALTMESANLFTIFRLLNDPKFRKVVVHKLQDEDLKIFWLNELGKAGEMQKVKMAAGITAKIGRFLFSASARRILEQDKSSINFDSAMDEKKIIICNFSKGLLGEDTSMLFGVTILAKLQLAALRRARKKHSERSPYFLYVDEFQNFATMSFVQMLSEARKYKLFLIMAEQSTQQQEEQRLVDIVLANVGTVIAFRSGSPADERLILPLFKPYVNEGEISSLPAYNFYCRILAIDAQEPLSGETVLLDSQSSAAIAELVKQTSRDTYGRVPLMPKEVKSSEADKPKKIVAYKKTKKNKKAVTGMTRKAST